MIEEPLTPTWARKIAFAFLFPEIETPHMATLVLGAVGLQGLALASAAPSSAFRCCHRWLHRIHHWPVVDNWIVSSLAPAQRIEGARLDSLRITSSTEGVVIPRLFGRMRNGGNIIWATDFREEVNTTTCGGGKGGGPKVKTTEYLYCASLQWRSARARSPALAGSGDGKPMDMTGVTALVSRDEAQSPDLYISAKMGAANTSPIAAPPMSFEELDSGLAPCCRFSRCSGCSLPSTPPRLWSRR